MKTSKFSARRAATVTADTLAALAREFDSDLVLHDLDASTSRALADDIGVSLARLDAFAAGLVARAGSVECRG